MGYTRQQRGRVGGLTTASRHDPRLYTQKARDTFAAWDHADCRTCGSPGPLPDGLEASERARRLDARHRLHMTRLSVRGVAARRRRAA